MPARFDSFGIQFLYPDNWKTVDREESEGDDGVTFDLPGGGFLSVELTDHASESELIDGIVAAISEEYEELEREISALDVLPDGVNATDLRFYYLDLLIVSRIVVLRHSAIPADSLLVVQMQAESRDFDKNEAVFSAVLKQIVDQDF
ncbi:MAG: hypothetical protein AAGJ83_01425 [Planctomycetota bacterium]